MGEEAMKDKYYYKDGTTSSKYDGSKVIHRIDGPAVEYANGDKSWYVDGKLHRIDGPAIEYLNGTKYWYMDGKLHRIDGPAIELADGSIVWWYVDDEEYSERAFNYLIKDIQQLPKVLRLIDPREWVRKL